jgi:hypothetical protein
MNASPTRRQLDTHWERICIYIYIYIFPWDALAARPILGEDEFRKVQALNKAAGVAKHSVSAPANLASWADISEEEITHAAGCGDPIDMVFYLDPWANAGSTSGGCRLWALAASCGWRIFCTTD